MHFFNLWICKRKEYRCDEWYLSLWWWSIWSPSFWIQIVDSPFKDKENERHTSEALLLSCCFKQQERVEVLAKGNNRNSCRLLNKQQQSKKHIRVRSIRARCNFISKDCQQNNVSHWYDATCGHVVLLPPIIDNPMKSAYSNFEAGTKVLENWVFLTVHPIIWMYVSSCQLVVLVSNDISSPTRITEKTAKSR